MFLKKIGFMLGCLMVIFTVSCNKVNNVGTQDTSLVTPTIKWFLISEWRGMKHISSEVDMDDYLPCLQDKGMDMQFFKKHAGKTLCSSHVEIVEESVRCLGIWKSNELYSINGQFDLGCKINNIPFDANTSFNADLLQVQSNQSLAQNIFYLINSDELKKRHIDIFYANKVMPVLPK